MFRSVESSSQITCRPAKYTVLPIQHTRTQKKRFPCLILGARIIDLPSKHGLESTYTMAITICTRGISVGMGSISTLRQ